MSKRKEKRRPRGRLLRGAPLALALGRRVTPEVLFDLPAGVCGLVPAFQLVDRCLGEDHVRRRRFRGGRRERDTGLLAFQVVLHLRADAGLAALAANAVVAARKCRSGFLLRLRGESGGRKGQGKNERQLHVNLLSGW